MKRSQAGVSLVLAAAALIAVTVGCKDSIFGKGGI